MSSLSIDPLREIYTNTTEAIIDELKVKSTKIKVKLCNLVHACSVMQLNVPSTGQKANLARESASMPKATH